MVSERKNSAGPVLEESFIKCQVSKSELWGTAFCAPFDFDISEDVIKGSDELNSVLNLSENANLCFDDFLNCFDEPSVSRLKEDFAYIPCGRNHFEINLFRKDGALLLLVADVFRKSNADAIIVKGFIYLRQTGAFSKGKLHSFVSKITHDINNQLTGIVAAASLSDGLASSLNRSNLYVEEIEFQVSKISQLLKELWHGIENLHILGKQENEEDNSQNATKSYFSKCDFADKVKKDEIIFVVNSDSLVRKMLNRLISSQGYTVYDASCVDEAVDFSYEQSLKVDLLVVDLHDTGIRSAYLLNQFKKRDPGVKMLLWAGMLATSEYQDEIFINSNKETCFQTDLLNRIENALSSRK